MSHFVDLSPSGYFGRWEESLFAVGWLESDHEFARGAVGEDVFSALVRLWVDPWHARATARRQPCPSCRVRKGPGHLTYQGMSVPRGSANLFVPGRNKVFAAPPMILHYVDAHEYAPPAELLE